MGLSERESSHLHLLGSYTSYFPSLPRYHVAIDQEKFVLTWRCYAVAVLRKEEEEEGGGDSHNGNGAGRGRPNTSTAGQSGIKSTPSSARLQVGVTLTDPEPVS